MRPAWTGVQSSRSRVIAADVGLSIGSDRPEAAEVVVRLRGGDAADGKVQVAADGRGDLVQRDALVGDRVQAGTGRRLLQRQPVEDRWPQGVAHDRPYVLRLR